MIARDLRHLARLILGPTATIIGQQLRALAIRKTRKDPR